MPPIIRSHSSVIRPSSVSAFLHVCTERDDGWWEYHRDIWAAYVAYCDSHGIRPDNKKVLAVLLQQYGAVKPKSNNEYRRWLGIKIVPKKTVTPVTP